MYPWVKSFFFVIGEKKSAQRERKINRGYPFYEYYVPTFSFLVEVLYNSKVRSRIRSLECYNECVGILPGNRL